MNLANDDAGSVIDDEEKKGLINELADRIERLFRKNLTLLGVIQFYYQ